MKKFILLISFFISIHTLFAQKEFVNIKVNGSERNFNHFDAYYRNGKGWRLIFNVINDKGFFERERFIIKIYTKFDWYHEPNGSKIDLNGKNIMGKWEKKYTEIDGVKFLCTKSDKKEGWFPVSINANFNFNMSYLFPNINDGERNSIKMAVLEITSCKDNYIEGKFSVDYSKEYMRNTREYIEGNFRLKFRSY